jgi:ketosteroid isomerase-like protein
MPPEHPNAVVARRLWEGFCEGDGDLLRELLTANLVWRNHGEHPFAGEVKGVEEIFDSIARSGEDVDELRSSAREIFASAGGAVIWGTTYAERGPKVLHTDYLLLLRIADGRVYEVSAVPMDQRHNDEFWRLQYVGLVEPLAIRHETLLEDRRAAVGVCGRPGL